MSRTAKTTNAGEVRCIASFVTPDDTRIALGERYPADHELVREHPDNFAPAKPLEGYDLVLCLVGFATREVVCPQGSHWHADDAPVLAMPHMFVPGYLTELEQHSWREARNYNSPRARAERAEARAAQEYRAEEQKRRKLERAEQLEAEAAAIREATA